MGLSHRTGTEAGLRSAMRRRDAFEPHVAETIDVRHGPEGESFVLGLSARWGEGKTHFLRRLGIQLENKGFQVIELNPWKYASDRVALLRLFLIELLETQPKWSRFCAALRCLRVGNFEDGWAMLMPRRHMLARLKTDVTRQRVSFSRFLLLIALVVLGYRALLELRGLSLRIPTNSQGALVGLWGAAATAVFGLSLWLVQGLVGSQLSSKASTTVDEFDRLISLALGGSGGSTLPSRKWRGGRKIAVLVDDLDRTTPEIARSVLDNLRTFFDKPPISFVVTGDHTVLETSVGSDLARGATDGDVDEGRRFMKKVFNLYWRLPAPVQSDFEAFVDGELASRREQLERRITRAGDRELLRDWLLQYCERNLRLVIRTLDMLLFTLGLVQAQYDDAPEEERPALREILDQPMLLGRVLMLQDRCPGLFELIVETPSLLEDLDYEVAIAKEEAPVSPEKDAVADFLKTVESRLARASLTRAQEEFLQSFAYAPPLFYDSARGGRCVANPGPWVHLAADMSFVDASGPRPEIFARDLVNLNAPALSAGIDRCSESRASDAAGAAAKALRETADLGQRTAQLLLILRLCGEAEPAKPLAAALVETVVPSLDEILAGLTDEASAQVVAGVIRAADRHLTDDSEEAASALASREGGYAEFLGGEPLGGVGSTIVLAWLLARHEKDPVGCLGYLEGLLPTLDCGALGDRLEALGDGLASELLTDTDDSRRDSRLGILLHHIPGGSGRARNALLPQLWRQDIWAWASRKAANAGEGAPWTTEELESLLVTWVDAAPDGDELVARLLYAAGKVDQRATELWRRLHESRSAELGTLLERVAEESAIAALPVPGEVATSLYAERARAVVRESDEARSIALAWVLDPANWVWEHLDRKQARKSLRPIAWRRAKRRNLQAFVRPFWENLGGGGLQILEATYGSKDKRIDVVSQLSALVADARLCIRVANALFKCDLCPDGDPCRNVKKDLYVKYRRNGQTLSKRVREDEELQLP